MFISLPLSTFNIKGELEDPRSLSCDTVAVSGGWNPTVHLFSQSGGNLNYDEKIACLIPGSSQQAVSVIGAAKGSFKLKA